MSRSEITLKLLIGAILGTELVTGPILLALGVFWDFDLVKSPVFTSTCLAVSAIVGAAAGLRFLPRFSRDRGRIADFLIDPRHVGPLRSQHPGHSHPV